MNVAGGPLAGGLVVVTFFFQGETRQQFGAGEIHWFCGIQIGVFDPEQLMWNT